MAYFCYSKSHYLKPCQQIIIHIIVIRRVTCHTVLIELQVQCKFQQPSVEQTEPPKSLCTYTVGTECPVNKESTYIIKTNYMSEVLHHLIFHCLFLFFVFLEAKWKRRRMLCLLLMKSTKFFFPNPSLF